MGTLGSFGTPRPAAADTFDYFGVELRVHPDITDVVILELFAGLADAENAELDMASAARKVVDQTRLIGDSLVHPDDVAQFRHLVKANRQSLEDLALLAAALLGALTDRPTKLPSDSSGGQRRTSKRSGAGSSSRALEVLDGRPDLQVAVVRRAREARPA